MRLSTCLVSVLALALPLCAQPTPAQPAFEVASIKPSLAEAGSSGWHTNQGLMRMNNQTLRQLISIAYSVSDAQIAGGPKWLAADRFDITAKPPKPDSEPEYRLMLRSLLIERFKLTVHRETRQFPGYSLVVAKGGHKMAKAEVPGSSTKGGLGKINATGASMPKLAELLTRTLRLPVVDATGI